MEPNEKTSGTTTSSFGVGKRESHDSTAYYARKMHQDRRFAQPLPPAELKKIVTPEVGPWADQLYLQSSEDMSVIPDNSVGLAFTSPPYNAAKDYDDDLSLQEYLDMIQRVGQEVYRVLRPGGRYVINIANLGRKPYLALNALFYQIHAENMDFLPMGEIIWQKAQGAAGSVAWGSWLSAKAPRLRDIHEYLLVFAKQGYSRPERGESDIEKDEFMQGTLSIWNIRPESAKRVGHPAPFPVELAERVIHLYSYVGDVVLDPFLGSGTTAVAAARHKRHYVGFDLEEEYLALAKNRLTSET